VLIQIQMVYRTH